MLGARRPTVTICLYDEGGRGAARVHVHEIGDLGEDPMYDPVGPVFYGRLQTSPEQEARAFVYKVLASERGWDATTVKIHIKISEFPI